MLVNAHALNSFLSKAVSVCAGRDSARNLMLFVIDVGNTNTVLGVFDDQQLCAQWRLTTNRAQTADEYGILMRNLFALDGIQASKISGIMVASVVPPLNALLDEMAEKYFH